MTQAQQKPKIKMHQQSDVIDLILLDHQPLKDIIQILKNSGIALRERKRKLDQFIPLLINHSQSEERSLYLFMESKGDFRQQSFEGEVEHELAELMVESLIIEKDEDMWSAKTKVLAELVEHHIHEEESKILQNVKIMTTIEDRFAMGQKYIEFKMLFDLPFNPHHPGAS